MMAMNDGGRDFLAEAWNELEFKYSNDACFTPYHLASMMARMTLLDVKKMLKEKGYFTMCEPSVGTGVMLIAAADFIEESGLSLKQMCCEATDVKPLMFKMAYLQLSIRGM